MSISRCPFFGKCGGCKFDFTSADYTAEKLSLLKKLPITNKPIWIEPGNRRRGDFAYLDNIFGFYEQGSKNIIPIKHCPALTPGINKILPSVAAVPMSGAGSVLITECDNGIDIAITSTVPYYTAQFKAAVDKLDAIRVTYNDRVIKQTATPIIKFGDVAVEYPPNAFLQPSKAGEEALRNLVVSYAAASTKVADLFSGQGSFTYALNADGFDINGGIHRDLFKKPLTVHNLKKYDCVVLDPPRAGAREQCRELAKSDVPRVIYVSCNPETFMRDASVLEKGGYKLTSLTPVDQFVGAAHWELVGVFYKR